ncbi:MAG TPA: heavy metal-associated domain-containing protein [Roseimicrobium sp.]|nr:heavy metal-associated domain-containing protein [Roseimicrobium sp.]
MKNILATLVTVFSLVLAAQAADKTVKLSKVHLCCGKCVKGVEAATAKVSGVTATIDKDAGTVDLSGKDAATVQKAVDAIVGAGYFATSSDASIKVASHHGAKDAKVQSVKVTGVHLCCDKCVKAAAGAVGTVAGVKGNTATKGADEFEVTGDFNAKDVFAALEKAGFSGKAGK